MMKSSVWAAYGFDIDANNIWFCSYWDNFLCCYSLEEKKLTRIERIPEQGKYREFLFSNVVIIESHLIALIPSNASSLFLYDIEKKTFKEFPVDISENIHNKFCGAVKYKKYLYIFPVNCNFIMQLNLENNKIRKISDWNTEIETFGKIMAFQMKNCIYEKDVFLLSALSNKILRFNMEDESYQIYEIGKGASFCTMTHLEKEVFLLCDEQGNFTIANLENGNYTLYENKIENFEPHEYHKKRAAFIDDFIYEGKVYLIPGQANRILEYSIDEKVVNAVSLDNLLISENKIKNKNMDLWTGEKYSFVYQNNNICYGFILQERALMKWDLKLKKIEKYIIDLTICKREWEEIVHDIFQRKIVTEDDAPYMSLINYIQLSINKQNINNQKQQIGKCIYQQIIRD